MNRKRLGFVGVVAAVILVLSITIFVVNVYTAAASCQPAVSTTGIPVATPNAAQKQVASMHNCGGNPLPYHTSTQTGPQLHQPGK